MSKQPTAYAFTKKTASWATFVLSKIDKQIEDREDWLKELGVPADAWDYDEALMKLYDEQFFYQRYADEMKSQSDYFREKYL